MKDIIAELGVAIGSTSEAIKKWRLRGAVPPVHHHDLRQAAAKRRVSINHDDFFWEPSEANRKRAKSSTRKRRAGA